MSREYKSDVFSMLLEDKKNALEVYNALNNTNYADPDQSFYHETETPQLELICRIYNINPHQNTTIKEKSPVLGGYTSFVEKVRTYQNENRNVDDAVDMAIEDCIREHILEDFFRKRKDEVKKVTHLDYTWEQREKLIRREEYEQGVKLGRTEGIELGRSEGIELVAANMLQENHSVEEIQKCTGLPVERIIELAEVR